MKFLTIFFIFSLISLQSFSQDSNSYLSSFYNNIYSLKSKGIQDFVVDVTSSRLTEELNNQKVFGNIKKLIFRVYWTANPERVALEIMGLPDGFREIKESLKISFATVLEDLLPLKFDKKFAGFKLGMKFDSKTYELIDLTGINPISKFILQFDNQDNLIMLKGIKPVGDFIVTPKYKKTNFSDNKWVLESQKTMTTETGLSTEATREYDYSVIQGVGVIDEISLTSETRFSNEKIQTQTFKDVVEFENYKINQGLALKYFLKDKSEN